MILPVFSVVLGQSEEYLHQTALCTKLAKLARHTLLLW